jgi:hypothetical protein
MTSTSYNYELWNTRKFLGVFRAVQPDPLYWTQWFTNEILSSDEWIDFERMPILSRKLAPFVLPLGKGSSVWSDSSTGYRFKPAYAKTEDQIDPLMPLTRRVGVDSNMIDPTVPLTPGQRLDLIRASITQAHYRAHERTLNYMAAVALRDGKITLEGPNYPTTLVDFQRDAGHTVTLTTGNKFGDSGVSILDFFQSVIDTMGVADFGAMPTRATMSKAVWNVIRKDVEIQDYLDLNKKGNDAVSINRGLQNSSELVYKVGEFFIGGASGASIELWVDESTYINPTTGVATRYVGNGQIVFTGSPAAIEGYQVFGRIIDREANWEPMRIFPKNWLTSGDTAVEFITAKSAPLMVPIRPNATFLGNVI